MTDFILKGLHDFAATSVDVTPQTDAARHSFDVWFGDGVTMAVTPKSRVPDLIRAIEARGQTYSSED